MKKISLSLAVILAFLLYAFYTHTQTSESLPAIVPPISSQSSPLSFGSSAGSQTSSNSSSGTYKDGSYKGNVTDAFYGNVQVQATISAGKITDVVFLDYPQDRRTSQEISSQAMPLLKQEAITALIYI